MKSARRSCLPLVEKIGNSHQFESIALLVKEAFCFKLTNETRGADLEDIRDQRPVPRHCEFSVLDTQKSRIDMLGEKYF